MRILIVVETFLPSSETFIFNLVDGLSDHEVRVAAEKRANPEQFPLAHPLCLLPKRPHSKPLKQLYESVVYRGFRPFHAASIAFLEEYIKDQQIDIIHAQFGPQGIRCVPLAQKTGIPLVVSFHGYDASSALRNLAYRRQLPLLFSVAREVILASSHMIGLLSPFGLSPDRTSVVPIGIDLRLFPPYPPESPPGPIPKIVHVGRFVNKKGVLDLLRVLGGLYAAGHRFTAELIGDGPELHQAQELAKALMPGGTVLFHGECSYPFVLGVLRDADILVLNSRTADNGDMEGTPAIIREAMATGLCVVSTIHAGIPETITSEESGLLVPERDTTSLSEAIARLLDNPSLRRKLGAQAYARAHREFSHRSVVSIIERLYERALASRTIPLS